MIKDDFPYFKNKNIVYLDNASTAQKPQSVIDSTIDFYTNYYSNTHRGSYKDGNRATEEFENSRAYLRAFIGTDCRREVFFTKGVTESINIVAQSYVRDKFKTVIISSLEHHSNIVPWHMQGRTLGNGLEVVKFTKNLNFDLNHFEELLKKNPGSFVSVTHVSNAFGVIHPVREIVKLAHKYGAIVLIDGAQSLSRFKVDVKNLDVDFYTISGHKNYGPTGVGALYVKKEHLRNLLPYQTGGAVIDKVTFSETTLLKSPYVFEAGTQNIAGVIGLKPALEYMEKTGFDNIIKNEEDLKAQLYTGLQNLEGIELYTTSNNTAGNISFNIKGIEAIDIGMLLDKQGVYVRAGHHCAMPIMDLLKINGTVRVSLGLYNDRNDIDIFFSKLSRSLDILRG